ncbi:DUF6572 domain-containing protein [Acidovorax sp.]|uniref:DUF6572 domain-containing protein n=1 Tax=Acidovorax sp. TaxID=1872122 RepID=UPI003919C809
MSVEQHSSIDAIGIDRASGKVHLTVSDHLPWDGEHLVVLQAKLNTYLAFLESGEVYVSYPNAKGRDFVIDVLVRYRPDAAALEFLVKAQCAVEGAGFAFRFRPLDGYAKDAA